MARHEQAVTENASTTTTVEAYVEVQVDWLRMIEVVCWKIIHASDVMAGYSSGYGSLAFKALYEVRIKLRSAGYGFAKHFQSGRERVSWIRTYRVCSSSTMFEISVLSIC